MIHEDNLKILAEKWKMEAYKLVPEEYAVRGLADKYFKLDNEASGLISCADELLEMIEQQAVDAACACCTDTYRPHVTRIAVCNKCGLPRG